MSRVGGKLTYERDFLLQLQTHPMSMLKPEGLPDLEIVLGQARPPSESGFQQKMPKTDAGENIFLPSYLRQNSRNNSSNQRAGHTRNVQPKKTLGSEQLKRSDKRWMQPSEEAKEGSEEELKTEVEYTQIPMGGPPQMQYRPQQAMQGQFPPVSGPSQPQGPYGYPQTQVYPMGQPSPPVYIVRAPSTPMTGMPQYQTQNFEPHARERKVIKIKDPNSNKDLTQEILNRQPSGSLTGSTTGTPNNSTPDISGQSSNSSTPPLTIQQQAEANVRAQFAAQVAATLANDSEEKPKKVVEYTIQKAPVNNKIKIKDPDSNKEVTQEILDRQPSGSLTDTQYQALVYRRSLIDAAYISETSAKKPKKAAEYTIQKAPVNDKTAAVDSAKDMKKKKQKQHLEDMERCSSEKGIDLMKAYIEKPPKEEVEYTQIPMGGPPQMQYRPQQAMQGQFPPVSGPSQPQGPYGYPQTQVYPMGQPSPPVYIVRAPSTPMTGMPQYQTQNFEPHARERKVIKIKDPNSNKDVTQEILNRQPSGSLTGSTTGTPNNSTPDISGQSSNSSTPPLTIQQQAEANVRAQFAAQVAATLANDSEEKPKKVVEYTIQKAPVNNKIKIKDPDSNKEVTQEILDRQPSGSLTDTQYQALVYRRSLIDAAYISETSAKKPKKAAEYTIQKAPVNDKTAAVDSAKDMKKKKQKQHLEDMERCSSEKGIDLMKAYIEKPPKEEVEYTQIPMGGPPQMQYRPQQAMQGQFPPVSGPSQPQGPYGYPQTQVYPMGQPSPPVYIVRAPSTPMTGMPQYQTQNFEPHARERKVIKIKDPNSNKDVTQEILNRQPSGSLTGSTTGTPNNSTPDISGQSSNSSTPPLTIQQQAEANVRAQFAAQVAATLANDSEEKPKKVVEYTIQKAPVNNKMPAVDSSKIKEVADMSKDKVAKEAKISSTVNVSETQLNKKPVENVVETQPKEEVAKRPKEAVQGSKLNDRVSVEKSLGAKTVVSSVDAITSTKGIIPNVRVEIFQANDVHNKEQSHKEAQQSSAAASDVKTAVEPVKETAEPAAAEVVPVEEAKTLNGPVTLVSEEVHEIEEAQNIEVQATGRGPLIRRKDEQEENLQRQLRVMGQQLKEKDEQGENLQRKLREMEKQLREKEKKLQRQLREMEEQVISLQGQCKEKDQESSKLERQLRDRYQDLVEVHKTLSETERKLEKCKCQEKRDWIIPRDDILITDKSLGSGAWGYVHEGKYCGCTVAVKKLHEKDIISPCNRGKFEREMDIASRCRHPCLLQFIGATNDEESPLFVTELMELSLRQLLNKQLLSDREVVTISLDVARALSYLHKKRPSPILHRDVSSANVLLWRRGNQWRAKVSDYGTANFLQDTMTANPGAMIYSAPEACARTQTVKIDVYSFGVLLCEMCTREMPEPDRRDAQVQLVKNPVIQALVRRCVQSAAEGRPSMEEIIEELEQLNGTS